MGDDLAYQVASTIQGEAWFLGGQIAVAWSIICNIAKLEAQGVGHVAAVRLALKKYTGREEPGWLAKDIAELVHDPERFLRSAKALGYHFGRDDPDKKLIYCMGGLVDVGPREWADGDLMFWAPWRVGKPRDSIHLYFRHPDEQAEQEPESELRPMLATLEMDL